MSVAARTVTSANVPPDATASSRRAAATVTGRVLILRCCRPAQFAAAVRLARQRNPHAAIVAVSHRGHRAMLEHAGVDDIVEVPGTRFGLWRMPPWTLARLALTRFDEVVIPQMTAYNSAHLNLYWMTAALRRDRTVIVPGNEPVAVYDHRAYRVFLLYETLGALPPAADIPVALVLLALASLLPRRTAPHRTDARPRVLHVIPSLGVGGAQRQLFEVINSTPPARYHVDVLVFGDRADGFSRQWLTRTDIEIRFLARWPQKTLLIVDVALQCRAGRYDIVHTWLFAANVLGAAGARLAGVPRVVASVRSPSTWKRVWYRQWWLRPADVLAARTADVITVNATPLVADHSRWALIPKRRIAVVHNGLEPSRFLADRLGARRQLLERSGATADATLVGTVGRLAIEKDQALLLRALHMARRHCPTLHGIVIGDGVMRAELEALAARLGLGGAVTFLGERGDAVRLMAGLDVFLLPSLIEGFPNALLEAAFLGVPAISSRVGGSTDILPDPWRTFPPGDAAGAATALLTLATDADAAAAHAARTRQRALELFTADRTAAAWFALYDRC